jgi:acyl-CoA synthetase (AMP-forming)/AMP-acid ligase II
MIRIWRGFHSSELLEQVHKAWHQEELLILCPPGLKDFTFLNLLPKGQVQTIGDWKESQLEPPERDLKLKTPEYPDRPILGVFTSGTVSGSPRLVLYSKANLEASLNGIRSLFDVSRIDTIFCYPQPFHTFGLVLGYVHAAVHGLKLVSGEGRYSHGFHAKRVALRQDRVLTLGIPAHFHDLLSYTRTHNLVISPTYSCILGGAKVSVSIWHAIRDSLQIEAPSIGYGASEASPGITHLAPGRAPTEEGEIGQPLPGVSLQLVPQEGLEFRGPNVCLAIIQDGKIEFPKKILLKDRIRQRADGILIYEGRSDLLLNRGGIKFSLERIEAVLRETMRLETVCVALPDVRLGEELGVLISPSPDDEASTDRNERMRLLLLNEFGCAFDSKRFIEAPHLPLNHCFKIDRKESARLFMASI